MSNNRADHLRKPLNSNKPGTASVPNLHSTSEFNRFLNHYLLTPYPVQIFGLWWSKRLSADNCVYAPSWKKKLFSNFRVSGTELFVCIFSMFIISAGAERIREPKTKQVFFQEKIVGFPVLFRCMFSRNSGIV